jgi:hypothetical protein
MGTYKIAFATLFILVVLSSIVALTLPKKINSNPNKQGT